MSVTSSPGSCQRVTAGAPVGVTSLSKAAARLAVRLRRAPPGTRSISSRCNRLMVWVRAANKSSRRLVRPMQHHRMSSAPTCYSCGAVWTAMATETASSGRARASGRLTALVPGRPAWRDVHHSLAVADQALGERPADAVGPFYHPTSVRPLSRHWRSARSPAGWPERAGRRSRP